MSNSKSNPRQPAHPAAASTEPFPTSFTCISEEGDCTDVDPLVLAGTSKVFSALLRRHSKDKSFPVSEGTKQLRLYLQAVKEGVATSVDEESWCTLFEMADKYEVKVLLSGLRHTYQNALVAFSSSGTANLSFLLLRLAKIFDNPVSAFAAGILLGNHTRAKEVALRALRELRKSGWVQNTILNRLPEVERLRLETYGHRHLEAQRNLLLTIEPAPCKSPKHSSSTSAKLLTEHWNAARVYALAHLKYGGSPANLLEKELDCDLGCEGCLQGLESAVEKVRQGWRGTEKGEQSVQLF